MNNDVVAYSKEPAGAAVQIAAGFVLQDGMIGTTISHYRILEKLGEGGMGVVYKTEDLKLKRIVALKFLPPLFSTDDEVKQRFIHEAQAASALNHPNICSIHTIEESEKPANAGAPAGRQQFIDMEFVEGKTLGALLKEKELSLKETVGIALQIAEGLNAAHRKGIVHRDIKPDNIMITDEHLVKIMDFGLAKLKGSSKLTKTHSTLGTLSYMSPEQARGEDVDQRSDIFSFGAVIYEMITGRQASRGEHEAAIMYSLMNETPEPLARYKTNVPNELQAIVSKALSKEKGERYQHADEMVADLRRIRQGASEIIMTAKKKSNAPWLVAAVVVVAVVGVYLFYPKTGPPSGNRKSIAVLPFRNMSDSKDDDYFADGLTEDIITQLSKISGLEKVIARTSVMRYKQTEKSIRDIGKELAVATVLEGSVRRSGNQIRVVAQLIDAESEGHIWVDTYDKEMTQIFAIQSDVAQQIASALKARLSSVEKSNIEKTPTENTEAYQFYLKGRFYWNKRSAEDLEKAMDYFHKALEKDPNYALAYAGLASVYAVYPEYSGRPLHEYILKAKDAANRALEFEGTLSEPHAVLGYLKMNNEWDWDGAQMELQRAIELNPNLPTEHQWYGQCLMAQGRFDEALAEMQRAEALDPLSLVINTNLGYFFIDGRQYDKAIDQFKKTLELDPNHARAHGGLGQAYVEQGKGDDAIAEFEKRRILAPNDPQGITELGWAYARTGKRDDALWSLNQALEFSRQGYSLSYGIAEVYSVLNDKDKTFEWLNKACEERHTYLRWLKADPMWDKLHSDPRYHELLKKIGLDK